MCPQNSGVPGIPVAQGGETLQQIASQVWGDASYWYKIAEANGPGADATLTEGQTLNLPSGVVRSSRDTGQQSRGHNA